MARKRTKYTLRKDGRIVLSDTINGERKYFYGKTDKEVEQKRDDYIRECEKHANEAADKGRAFEAVADDWWEQCEPRLSPNTVCGYRTAKNRAVDAFGDQYVTDITGHQIVVFLQRFAARGYSQKVINNTKSVMRQILNYAFLCGDIDANPCIGIPTPKGNPRVPRKPTPPDDLQKIEESKTESLFARMSYFMAYTGARRGEAAALKQKDIDLTTRTACVARAVAYSDTRKPVLKSPKTEAGVRYLDLPDNVIEVLPHYDDPETFIFFPDGLPTKTELESGLKKYQQSHGIQSTAHQLRHAYASMLHSANIDVKDAQYLLGHSTIAMTQDIYTDLEDKRKQQVHNKVNRYVKRSRKLSKVLSESDKH